MRGANRWINDVDIAVRRAASELLRVGLCVAHRHAEPEGRVQLEVVTYSRSARETRCWIVGERELVSHSVARPGHVRVEEGRRFIVSDVFPLSEDCLGVVYLCAHRTSLRTIEVHWGSCVGMGY